MTSVLYVLMVKSFMTNTRIVFLGVIARRSLARLLVVPFFCAIWLISSIFYLKLVLLFLFIFMLYSNKQQQQQQLQRKMIHPQPTTSMQIQQQSWRNISSHQFPILSQDPSIGPNFLPTMPYDSLHYIVYDHFHQIIVPILLEN